MDLDNDELAYTTYFREIRAYNNLANINEMVHPDSEFAENVEILREFFKNYFNRKVSKKARLK